jgi:hypothetical protein
MHQYTEVYRVSIGMSCDMDKGNRLGVVSDLIPRCT